MRTGTASHRTIETALFLISFLSFAYFYQAADQSTAARFDLMRAIVEHRCLWIDDYCGMNTADIIFMGPHIYSVKAPGASFVGLVPWIVASNALKPLRTPFHDPRYWAFATYLTIVFSTSLLVAALTVLLYRFAVFLGVTVGRAASIALIGAFGTILFPYATEFTGEPIAATCAFAAFYLLATQKRDPDTSRAALAGFLAGWAVLNDYPAMLIAVALAIYALFKLESRREVFAFAVGAAATAVLLIAYNYRAFGHPLFMSYQAYKLPGNRNQFPEQAAGFVGLTYPRLRVLWNILIDPQRGLFFCNPVLLLMIPGLVFLWRRRENRAEAALTAFAAIGFIAFNASFGESIISWGGGTATGPRQLAPAIPFMVLALAFIPSEWDYILGALAAVSVLFMLAATAVEPHFPYEYDNPVRDFALPAYFRGDLAFNENAYFGPGAIAGDSVAFNLGKLFGLPGAFQLWPLAALWIGGAAFLIRSIAPPRGALLKAAAAAIAIAALFVPPTVGALTQAARASGNHGLLGRYYEGLDPTGFPPHLVRVDPQIDFNNVAELGAMPFSSHVVWSGKILAPRTGTYAFGVEADDSGWVIIDGRPVISDPGPTVTKLQDRGVTDLEAGWHRIEVHERNIAGDAFMRLYWQPPDGGMELVPKDVLVPDRADEERPR
ncbi:MAG: PA14 domain-containing protein [Candidatus Binataceae bacterium]